MNKFRFKNNQSITMIETCVGIVILSIALTAIVQVFYFSALATTTIERKSRMLNFLESEAEAMMIKARLGEIPPLNQHIAIRRDEFYGSYRVTDLGNNLLLFAYEVAWPRVKITGGSQYNIERLSFFTTSFISREETRTTGEGESIIRFQ